jgi:tRNA-dihydrouridine synthase B
MIATSGKTAAKVAAAEGPLGWVARAPFYQAGLAGYSDTAMRLVARKHGCPYCITEAMLDQALLNGGRGLEHAELHPDDHPIGGQIMGNDPADMAAAAKLLVGMGYDVIDINFGCPVKKIKKKNRGGQLLSSPPEAIAILDAVKQAIGDAVPLTVKMRRSYDDTPEMVASFYTIFEKAIELGYQGVTVHGRTVEQKYLGPARWPFLTDLTQKYRAEMERGLLIWGSGDIVSSRAIFEMVRQTGVHGVSVARGCIGNPWIFTQANQMIAGREPTPPNIRQQRAVLLEHFELSVATNGESVAGRMMRKFGIKFALHHPRSAEVKAAFIKVTNLAEWHAALNEFYREDDTTAGVEAAPAAETEEGGEWSCEPGGA